MNAPKAVVNIASIDDENGEVVALYHPRTQSWPENFQLADGNILPVSANARVTVKLLQLNRSERQLLIAANLLSDAHASQTPDPH